MPRMPLIFTPVLDPLAHQNITGQLFDVYPTLKNVYHPFEQTWSGDMHPWAIAHPYLAVYAAAIYVVIMFGLKYLMRERKPFDLKVPLAAWNLLLAVFSGIGTLRTVPHLLYYLYNHGFEFTQTYTATTYYGSGACGFWVALFIYSKYFELIDTLFIVLRKRPLIFLHWYHHVTVMLFCWHAYTTSTPYGLYFVAMNYTVHAIMYFYYFLSAVGCKASWGKFVTTIQILQMVGGIIVTAGGFYYKYWTLGGHNIDSMNPIYAIIMYASYLVLFAVLYVDLYIKRSRRAAEKKLAAKSE
eukprot:GILJ01001572.1.p1 GENE.GILJ01001572.1~~GILJ01001572.1.p1  ORF type:complete len:298 (+),score=23.06 GILJ01001572.1:90-983(+)